MGTLDLPLWVLVEPLPGCAMAEGEGSGSCRVAQALGLHGSCELLLLQGAVLQGCHKLLRLLGAQGERKNSTAQSLQRQDRTRAKVRVQAVQII